MALINHFAIGWVYCDGFEADHHFGGLDIGRFLPVVVATKGLFFSRTRYLVFSDAIFGDAIETIVSM